MTEYEQLKYRKQAIDGCGDLAYYVGGESVLVVGEGHLAESWKTAQKVRNGKKHRRAKSGKLG